MKEKLHIANFVRDDKFIDGLIKFQDLSSEDCVHDYIIVSKKTILYKSIKSTNRIKVVPASMILQFIKENNYNAVFLHSLVCMPYYYISQIHREIPVFWFAWGFDIYGYLIKVKRLHLKTILCKYTFFLKDSLKTAIQHLIQSIKYSRSFGKMYQDAVERIDYFSGVIPVEYELARQNKHFKALPVEYYYCDVDALSVKDYSGVESDNILIGNSCDINNNHLDLLDYFHNVDLKNRKVILPINYSGNTIYKRIVSKAYKRAFGNDLIVIDKYLPLKQYRDIVNSASVGIFFHERQQAMGNIEMFLLNGGKLFLSQTSVIYKYLKSKGFFVFSIQEDLCTSNLDTPLTNEQKRYNRNLWLSLHSLEAEISKLNSIYRLMKQHVSRKL